MSHVTNVVLWCSVEDAGDDEPWALLNLPQINAWLEAHVAPPQSLIPVDHVASGAKPMEVSISAGAFNYLNLPDFIAFLRTLHWNWPHHVRLIVQEQHADTPTMYELDPNKNAQLLYEAGWDVPA